MHAKGFKDGAHRSACNDAGSGRCCTQEDAPCPMPSIDVVVQRAAFPQRNPDQGAFRGFGCLANRFGNLARLAMTVTDAALLIADYDKRREAESAAALHHLRNAVDMDQTIHKFAIAILALAATPALSFTRHRSLPLSGLPHVYSRAGAECSVPLVSKLKPAFARALCT